METKTEVQDAVVYAPQQPSRFDAGYQLWVPTVDLTPARKFGELRVMLPPNFGSMVGAPLVEAIKERMAGFRECDFLLAVGDPTLIAAAAGVAALRTGGRLRVLKWDRHMRDYILIDMRL